MINARKRYILRATAGYAVVSALWILLSDQLLSVLTDVSTIAWLSMVKGVTFVLVTAALLYFALQKVPAEDSASLHNNGPVASPPETLLAISETASRTPRWLIYVFAVAVTAAMLLVRAGIVVSFGERPLLILLMFPIIFSALIGGLGPGIASVSVAAFGTAYFIIPPVHHFLMAAPHDQLQWGMLLADGVLVSILSEAMHKSFRRAKVTSQHLNAVISGTPDAVFVKDLKGRYQLFNEGAARLVGRPASEAIGHDATFIFATEAAQRLMALDRSIMDSGRTRTDEESVTTIDGKELTFYVTKGPVFDQHGKVSGLFGISRDITQRKQTEREKEDTMELLRLCNGSNSVMDLMHRLVLYFQKITGCSAVGVRLRQGEDFPYYETNGFPEDFVLAENSLCALDQKGELVRDSTGHPALDCMCGNIICGRFDPAKAFFSPRGSFWSSCTTELLASTSEADRQAKTRNRCNGEGYESVALVPLRAHGEIFGLFQFNDRRKGRFTAEKIARFEDLVNYVAIALAKLRADEALCDSEERYRILFEASRDAIMTFAPPTWKFASGNKACMRLFGARDEKEFVSFGPSDLSPDFQPDGLDSAQKALDMFSIAMQTGSHFFEWQHKKVTGEEFPATILLTRITLKDKVFLQATVRDITEQRQAELALRYSEAMYRSLFDNMLNGFAYCRMLFENDEPTDFIYLKVNMAFETLTGLKDVIGKRVSDVIPGIRKTDPGVFEIYGRVALTGRPERFELFVHALQMWFWISVYSPKPEHFVAVFDVITERKKAEEEKAIYQRQLELLLETAGEGIFGVNGEGKITFVNQAAIRMMGHSKDGLIGRNSHEVFHSHRIDGALFPWQDCPLRNTLNDGVSRSGEETYYRQDGSDFPIEFSCTAIIEGGVTSGAVMLFRDITERRKIESELRQAQKIEGVGQLAGGMAHDFNNVLSAIVGFAGILQMKMDKSDPLVHYADEIMAAGHRGAALTRQILAFSRKQVLDMRPVNLNEIVNSLKKMLHRLVREDIDIQYNLTKNDLVIFADAGQIGQTLMNLVTNGRDAMPHGGRLGIATEASVIDTEFIEMHGYGSPGEYAVMTISDTGCGMDALTMSHIFEPFFTTKESVKGTGLGLAVVHGIVKQHNGYINVSSIEGIGTDLKIYLPLTEHEIKETEDKADDLVMGGTETILIAEDDGFLRTLSKTVLSQYGYKVIDAIDGEDAVRKFEAHKDDIKLVVLDGIMPNKNGKEAYDDIRKFCPGMKAIFMSGYAEDILPLEGIREKTAVFIQKPVTPNYLLRKVRAILDN